MIQIFAYDQEYENQHLLDVSDAAAVSINYEVGKLGDLVGRSSPYSQSFRLPFTPTNNKFFRQFYNINVETTLQVAQPISTFDADFKVGCSIRDDGVPVITGTLQLIKCSTEEEMYEVVVYGTEADFFQSLEERKLKDAFREGDSFTTDYNVNINDDNILDSWDLTNDVTLGGVGAGRVIFPLIDYGLVGDYNFLYLENNASFDYGLAAPDFIQATDFKPAIKLDTLFRKVVTSVGYTVTTNDFLTSDAWTKAYMTLGTDRETVALTTMHQSQVANTTAPIILNWGLVAGTNGAWQDIVFPTQSGAGLNNNPPLLYDSNDDWNAAGEFIFPYNGQYHGVLTATFDTSEASIAEGATLTVFVIGSGGLVATQSLDVGGNDSGSEILTTFTLPFTTPGYAGNSLTVKARASCEAGYQVDLMGEGTFCTMISTGSLAGVCDLPANLPDIAQKDFIIDLAQRFNLVIIADDENQKTLSVMPWEDYIALAERKDWTHKLDLSQERVISPTTKYKKQSIVFTDLEDEDTMNVSNQRTYGEVFGTYNQSIQGDFLQGELTNKAIFSPFSVNPVPRQDNSAVTDAPNLVIHKGYSHNTEGPLASCKPKLFYHNGLKLVTDDGLRIYVGDKYSYTYPLCLPYLNTTPPHQMAVDSPLLSWQFQIPMSWVTPVFGTTPSSEGYFKRYWQQFLASYYDSAARVFECSLYLTAGDVHNFQFNDEIVIEDTAYRVLKISGFQPFSNVPTKVQLLKKITALAALQLPDSTDDCEARPTGFLADGTVVFESNLTGAVVISEVCCTDFHYYWDGTDCYWSYGGGGGGGGDPTTGLGGRNPHGDPSADTVGGLSDLRGVGGFHSRKRGGVPNPNPIIGEHSIRGNNVESFANSVNKNFVYYATSSHTTATTATPNGEEGEQSGLQIPYNTMARFIVRALSVQTHVLSAGAGSYGSSSFNVWTFLIKNVAGTITVVGSSEQTDFQEADADAGTRTVAMVGAEGKTGFAGNRGVEIECTGPERSMLAWHLDCAVTYIDFGYATAIDDLILTEDLNYLTTENGFFIEQE